MPKRKRKRASIDRAFGLVSLERSASVLTDYLIGLNIPLNPKKVSRKKKKVSKKRRR